MFLRRVYLSIGSAYQDYCELVATALRLQVHKKQDATDGQDPRIKIVIVDLEFFLLKIFCELRGSNRKQSVRLVITFPSVKEPQSTFSSTSRLP